MTEVDLISQAKKWLIELLRIDTSNPPGRESQVVSFVAKILAEYGITSHVVSNIAGRDNLIAKIEGSDSSTSSIILSSHADVVPAGEASLWKHPPFEAVEDNGEIYARGALDMKYKLAFDLACFITLKKQRPKCSVTLVVLTDEERGGEHGIRFLLEKYRELLSADYVLNEVGGFTLYFADKCVIPIQCAEKGRAQVKVSVTGTQLHASLAPHDNSIVSLSKALAVIDQHSWNFKLCQTSREFFSGLERATNSPLLKALLDPSSVSAGLAAIPDRALALQLRAVLGDTICVTEFNSGVGENICPQSASATLDIRLIPGSDIHELLEILNKALKNAQLTHVKLELLGYEAGYEINISDRMYQEIVNHTQAHWPTAPVVPLLMPAGSDNTHYAHAGITPIGFAPLWFEAGFPGLALSHAIDERIPVKSFEMGLACYLRVVSGLVA